MVNIGNDWDGILADEWQKPYYQNLRGFLKKEYGSRTIYPNMNDIFNALKYTDYDKVKVVKEDKILLAQGDQLAGNQIIWYPENFARLSGDCKLKLSLVHTNGDLEDMNISVANPNIMDFWNIGIMPLEGLEFKVVLGNKNTYSCSDKFSYL